VEGSPNRNKEGHLILNANPHGREDLVVTPLQAKVMESKGYGKIPEQFQYQPYPKEEEVLHKELVEKFGENYEDILDQSCKIAYPSVSQINKKNYWNISQMKTKMEI